MRNIWAVSKSTNDAIDQGFFGTSSKGQFFPEYQEVMLNQAKIDSQLDYCEKYFNSKANFLELQKSAAKKVVMHEFEHGLQTRYDHELDQRFRHSYENISNELAKMPQYRGMIRLYEEIPKEIGAGSVYLSTGCHISSRLEQPGVKTYRKIDGVDNLNEILNETESLEMARQKTYLYSLIGKDGNCFPLRNPESSNDVITNYGNLFKIVFGGKNTFNLMYIDPISAFQDFNNLYNDVFQNIYNSDKDASELFMRAITDIKQNKTETSHLTLCLALSKCLEKKLETLYNNSHISNQELLGLIKSFESYCITNKDEQKKLALAHQQVLEHLKQEINERDISNIQKSSVEYSTTPITKSIPTFTELKECTKRYELASIENNRPQIKDLKTGEVVSDENTIELATFANIWLTSAGIKWTETDVRKGDTYAYNDGAKSVYNYFIEEVKNNLENTGNIDSISIFENAEDLSYKYSKEIITNLFRSTYQSEFINQFFRARIDTAKLQTENVQPLYDQMYAESISKKESNRQDKKQMS
ncbi:MAG: hypothetical protein PUC82_03330 [bacterium]|nr:hypothetical protein [bacterium]